VTKSLRSALGVLLCSALIVPASAGAVAQAVAPSSDVAPAEDESAPREIPVVEGQAGAAPQFSIAILQRDPARLGGSGRVDVVLTRRGIEDRVVRDAKVRISLERGTAITRASGQGWACPRPKPGARVMTCRHAAPIGATATPRPITVRVAVEKSAQRRTPVTHITAAGTWVGDRATKSSPWPKPWLVQDRGSLNVYPALGAKLVSPAGRKIAVLTGGDRESRQVVLAGSISGIEGGHVDVEWFVKSGPPVRFLKPRTIQHADEQVTQVVQYPNTLQGKRTSVIGMRVISDGRKVTRTVGLTLRASKLLGKVDGRAHLFDRVAKASRVPLPLASLLDGDDDHLVIEGPSGPVAPGSTTKLTVRSQSGAAIRSALWFSIDEFNVATAITTGLTATVTAGDVHGGTQLIKVAVVMATGEVHKEGYILHVLSPSDRVQSNRAGPRNEDDTETSTDPTPEPQPDANLDAYCAIARNILDQRTAGTDNPVDIAPQGGVKLSIKPSNADISKAFTGGVCTGESVMTFTGTTLEHPSAWTFQDVAGRVDPQGLTITQLKWNPPAALKKVFFNQLAITWGGSLTSTLSEGNWGLLGGEVDMQPVVKLPGVEVYGPEFIPLPGDWEVPKGGTKLTFTHTDGGAPKDNTLSISQRVTGPKDGVAVISANAVNGSLDSVEVSVANLVLGDNSDGDSLVAKGTGRLNFSSETAQRKIELEVRCLRDGELSGTCKLVNRLNLSAFKVTLEDDTISMSASAVLQYADNQEFGFALEGTYVNSKTWTLTGSTTNTWNLGDGLSMESVVGTISRRPAAADATKTDLLVDISGDLKGLTLGSSVSVTKLTSSVTNTCAEEDRSCVPNEIRLRIDADLQATLPGQDKPSPFTVRARANLSTLKFRFEGTADNVSFGPEGMKVTKARFVLTNEPGAMCRPKGATDVPVSGYTTLITGQVRLLEKDFTVNTQFTSEGYCIWGNSGPMQVGSEGMKTTSGLFVFSSFAGGAQLNVGDDTPVAIPPNTIQLSGAFDLPDSVESYLGSSGEVTYTAKFTTNLSAADFDLTLTSKDGVVLYEQTQGTEGVVRSKVTMDSVGLKVNYDVANAQASLQIFAAGTLTLPSQGDPTKASVTPLIIEGKFEFKKGALALVITAGVDTKAGPVKDAFGQPGLQISELIVSLTVAALPAPSVSVSLNADVILPSGWGATIGVKDGAPIKLAASLDLKAPCLAFAIGEETKEKRKAALDLANLGVITADYVKLLLAPAGCTLPSGTGTPKEIKPGYAFAFDGQILGSPTLLEFEVELGSGLKIKSDVDLPKPLDLYAVKLTNFAGDSGPKITLDIDTTAKKYDIDLDAALEIGKVEYNVGMKVAIKGSLRTSGDNIRLQMQGYAKGALGPISVEIPEKRTMGKTEDLGKNGLLVDLTIPKAGKSGNPTVNASAELGVSVVGLKVKVAAALNYSDGQLVELKAIVDTDIDILVAKLQARVQFDLCQGTLSAIKQDGSGSQCTNFTNLTGASPSIRVGVTGRYRILWWDKDYLWQAYNSVGKEGAAPTVDAPAALDLTTEIPEGVGSPQLSAAYIVKNHDVRARSTERFGTLYVKTLKGQEVAGKPACDTARVGAQAWNPTADDTNPVVQAQNVYPMQDDEACGLKVMVASESGRAPSEDTLVCAATFCYFSGSSAGLYNLVPRTGGFSGTMARNQALSGLTTPPGFVPSGGILESSGKSPTSVDGWDGKSSLRAEPFQLQLVNAEGKSIWSFGSKPGEGRAPSLSSHFELRGLTARVLVIQWVKEQSGRYVQQSRISVDTIKTLKVEPILVVSDGQFAVYDGSIGASTLLWGVKKDGSCFYNKDTVSGTLDKDFCKVR